MEYDSILLRYGEIFLKGKNKFKFENKLIDNIKKITFIKKIKNIRSRLIIDYFPKHDLLKKVFGLTSYSLAIKVEKDIDKIKKVALKSIKRMEGSFKVETKRSDKRFPIKSPDVNIEVGSYIEENSKLEFKLKNPDNILFIEINQDGAYLYSEVIKCHGGLPAGVEGKVAILLENENSLLAALLMMKRGCDVIPVTRKEFNISLLQEYSAKKIELKEVKDFSELNNYILVSGQTFENYQDYKLNEITLRPLIAYSEEEIKKELANYKN